MSLETDFGLLKRIKQNEELAWYEFYNLYSPFIRYYLRKMNLETIDIDQVIQQVVLKFVESPGMYDATKGSFRNFLIHIVRNTAIDAIRRKKDFEELDKKHDIQIEDDQEIEYAWQQLLLRAALEDMKNIVEPAHWQVFDLYVIRKDIPLKDISKITGFSPGTIYTIKSRIVGRLREIIAQTPPPEILIDNGCSHLTKNDIEYLLRKEGSTISRIMKVFHLKTCKTCSLNYLNHKLWHKQQTDHLYKLLDSLPIINIEDAVFQKLTTFLGNLNQSITFKEKR